MFIIALKCLYLGTGSMSIFWQELNHSNDSPRNRCAPRHQEFVVVDASDCFFS